MLINRLGRGWRRWQLHRQGADIANDLQSSNSFFSGEACGFHCGEQAWIAAGARIMIGKTQSGSGHLEIGSHLFMNHYSIINCHYEIVIGANVMLGPHAYVCDFDHQIVETKGPEISSHFIGSPIRIGNHVWIGANAVVLRGTIIGNGTIIGAGSVVTHDIPAMAIAVGNPASVLRIRPNATD